MGFGRVHLGRAHLIGIPSWKGGHLREARRRPGSELMNTWTHGEYVPVEGRDPAGRPLWLEQNQWGQEREEVVGTEWACRLGGESGSDPNSPVWWGCYYSPRKQAQKLVVQQWSTSPTQPGPRSSLSKPILGEAATPDYSSLSVSGVPKAWCVPGLVVPPRASGNVGGGHF